MAFRAATYNVLATAYLGKGDYSGVPPELLDPRRRVPALVRHVAGLGADLLCLQEVETDAFAALLAGLAPLGYAGLREPKGGGRPDGCATFYRAPALALREARRLEYHDGEERSGHVAQLLALGHEGRLVGVANTHLRWDKPGTPAAEQIGHRQAEELLREIAAFEPRCDGWLVCGDFNRGADSDVASLLRAAGYAPAHERGCSAVISGRGCLIDHLFHTAALSAAPDELPAVHGPLPSADQPSDHVAARATLAWKS